MPTRPRAIPPLLAALAATAVVLAALSPSPAAAQQPGPRRTPILTVRELRVPGGRVSALAYSPDGRQLAVGGPQGDVHVLDPATGAARILFAPTASGAAPQVQSLAWSEDGELLLVSTFEQLVSIEVETTRMLASDPWFTRHVHPLPDATGAGRSFVAIHRDGHTYRIDGATLERTARYELPDRLPAGRVAVSADGGRVAVSSDHDGRAFVFARNGGAPQRELDDLEGRTLSMAWPATSDQPLRVGMHKPKDTFAGQSLLRAEKLVAQPDGSLMAVYVNDGGWNLLRRHGSTMAAVAGVDEVLALSPDGDALAHGGGGGRVVLSGVREPAAIHAATTSDAGDAGRVRSVPSPTYVGEFTTGALVHDGRFAVVHAHGRATVFSVTSGDRIDLALDSGFLVEDGAGDALVWATPRNLSWWTLDPASDGANPELLRSVDLPPDVGPVRRPGSASQPVLLDDGRLLYQYPGLLVDLGSLPVDGQPGRGASPAIEEPMHVDRMGWFTARVRGGRGPGGAHWVVGGADGTSLLSATGEVVFTDNEVEPLGLSVSPDGTRVAMAVTREPVHVLRVDGEPRWLRTIPEAESVAFIDDDRVLCCVADRRSDETRVTIHHVDSGERIGLLTFEGESITLLDVDRRARRALIGSPGVARVISWR